MTTQTKPRFTWMLLLLVVYAGIIYTTMTLRYRGNWGEGDTTVVTRAIISSDKADSLIRANQPYPNGVGYVAIVMILSNITGVSAQNLQIYVMPLIASINIIVLFVGYRALVTNPWISLIATLFAYLQPDFLWVTWRGSHEKFTWMLVITLIFLLARSFIMRNQLRIMLRYVILFYIVVFALITSNVFFALSFTFAIALSFVAGNLYVAYRKWRRQKYDHQVKLHLWRLLYVIGACTVLFYLYIFYIYPDSFSALANLKTLADHLAVLFLGVQEATAETTAQVIAAPGNYLRISWLSIYVFAGLTAFTWIVLAISMIVWIVTAIRLYTKGIIEQQDSSRLIHLMLYGAFALQVAGATVADRVSVLSGNLQVRLFTPLVLVAIPLVAVAAYQVIQRLTRFQTIIRMGAVVAISLAIFYFSIAAVLKSTNEPLVNNWWIFTVPSEYAAGDWARQYLHDTEIWTGTNDRISSNLTNRYLNNPTLNNVRFYGYSFRFDSRYFMLSDMELAMRRRLRLAPPYFVNENVVYNNGLVQIYHQRPLSPYQH